MKKKTAIPEYYCVAVQRNYETVWRLVSKHVTREAAQSEVENRRAYTGAFNYDNAQLRVMTRTEGKKLFGPKWEYAPIGSHKSNLSEKTK